MKYFIFIFILSSSLYSCSVDLSVPDNYEHQGTWELVRTRSNMANADYKEAEARESYTFKNNGTFIKTRFKDASQEIAEGTYKLVDKRWNGAGKPLLFLELKFNNESPLIANCSGESIEHLIITSQYLLVNTWIACDGFLMEYEKTDSVEN